MISELWNTQKLIIGNAEISENVKSQNRFSEILQNVFITEDQMFRSKMKYRKYRIFGKFKFFFGIPKYFKIFVYVLKTNCEAFSNV